MTDTTKQASAKSSRPKRFARQPAETGASGAGATKTSFDDAPTLAVKINKTELVLGLLRREEGATLAEIVAATGWLPHSARAAFTGLRKKGHALEKTKRGEVTCYVIKASV